MFSPLMLKIIGGVGAFLLLALLVMDRNRQASLAKDRKEKLELICSTVRDSAGNPNMKCGDAVRQINLLAGSIADLKAGIAKQNAAADALATETARQKGEAERASVKAKERAQNAEATASRLRASSRAGGASTGVCEPSDELKRNWK